MRRHAFLVYALSILAVAGCSMNKPSADTGMVLTVDGKGKTDIVLARDASAPVQHAAAELADFLRQATGENDRPLKLLWRRPSAP